MFQDRRDAARKLARSLSACKGLEDALILAIPRGGVAIGAVLAEELGLPLDVIFTKKIGHPENPEYAIGVVDLKGESIDAEAVELHGVARAYLAREIPRLRALLREREALYHARRPALPLRGKTVLLCDDGVATGYTMAAAARLARREGARRIVIAAPVAAADSAAALGRLADEVVCADLPPDFAAIGQFYREFAPVDDAEAVRLLEAAPR